jgi:cytochrome c2
MRSSNTIRSSGGHLWNHGPPMADVMRAAGIERPLFRGTELRDLIAYITSESVAAAPGPLYLLPGDAEQGRRLFAEKHCLDCHRDDRPGPSLVGRGTGRDLTEFATAMWNKAPTMIPDEAARDRDPPLRGEMADLVAYLDSVGYFTSAGVPRGSGWPGQGVVPATPRRASARRWESAGGRGPRRRPR